MKNINSRKFKTTEQEKDDILKYYLLSQAFKAKQFYSDGDFANQLASSILNNQTTQQGNLYNDVDNIGLLISSDLFTQQTSEGSNMRSKTLKTIDNFTKKMDNDMRNGTITQDTYNNIKSYLDFIVGDALKNSVGNKGTKEYGIVLKSGIPQKLSSFISSQITVPLQQPLANLQVPEAPVNIGVPNIQQVSFGVDEQTLITILKNSNSIILKLRNEGQSNNTIKEQLKIYLQKMYQENPTLQVGKLYSNLIQKLDEPSIKFQETKNFLPQPAQPAQPELNQVIRGEKNTYTKNTPKYVPEPNDRADKHQAGQDIERTRDYAITRVMNQRQLYTDTFGIHPKLYDKIMIGLNNLIKQQEEDDVPFHIIDRTVENYIKNLQKNFPELEAEKLYSVTVRQIQDSMRSKQNNNDQLYNVSNSAKAIHGDRLATAVQNYQQFDSNQGDEREPPPKAIPQAQVQNLNNVEQLNNSLDYFSDKTYISGFLNSIMDREFPLNDDWRGDFNNVEREFNQMNNKIQYISNLYNEGAQLTNEDLDFIKHIFTLDNLKSVYEDIWSMQPDPRKKDEVEASAIIKRIIADMMNITEKNMNKNPYIWKLKEQLASTTQNPTIVYKNLLKNNSSILPPIYKTNNQNIYRGAGKNQPIYKTYARRNIAEKPVYPTSAKTSYVSQSVNQYSVGNTTYLT